jgi:hypothetical protein
LRTDKKPGGYKSFRSCELIRNLEVISLKL